MGSSGPAFQGHVGHHADGVVITSCSPWHGFAQSGCRCLWHAVFLNSHCMKFILPLHGFAYLKHRFVSQTNTNEVVCGAGGAWLACTQIYRCNRITATGVVSRMSPYHGYCIHLQGHVLMVTLNTTSCGSHANMPQDCDRCVAYGPRVQKKETEPTAKEPGITPEQSPVAATHSSVNHDTSLSKSLNHSFTNSSRPLWRHQQQHEETEQTMLCRPIVATSKARPYTHPYTPKNRSTLVVSFYNTHSAC